MHSFKKVLFSSICVLMIFLMVSCVIITPYLNSELAYYQDHHLRDSLEGKIDFMTIGASNGHFAFDTAVLDEELGSFSYNLANPAMTSDARGFFLEKELTRNPIHTVVFDISTETLTRDEDSEYANGEAFSLAKISTTLERVEFLLECVPFNDWLNVYAKTFIPGIEYWLTALKGSQTGAVDYDSKGYHKCTVRDVTLSEADVHEKQNQTSVYSEYREENIKSLEEQIQYCKAKGIRVILAVVPKSDGLLWEECDHDAFYRWMTEFSNKLNCEFYDFNLLSSRYVLFSDKESYSDEAHMSEIGAIAFTKAFCEIVQKAENEDVSDYFYNSYEAMKADSPYMAYME